MATERLQVYRCELCGNMVEVLRAGAGTLTCCNQPMTRLQENTTDAAQEKHVPVIEKTAEGTTVKVGSVPHPMEEAHLIEWIEVIDGSTVQRTYLKPGASPEAVFTVTAENITAREFCNLHGLWKR
jgi:superoxide reductase